MNDDGSFPADLLARIRRCGMIPTATIDDVSAAIPLAKALLACHIDVIEIALHTDVAFDAMRKIRDEVPGMMVAAGTILNPDQIAPAIESGAALAAANGLCDEVVQEARAQRLPFIPGIITPSELESAIHLGCRHVKVFPIEPMGGVKYLRTLAMPYEHLGIKYFVSGGITSENAPAYLYHEDVTAIGAGWIASRPIIQSQQWSDLINHAVEATGIVKEMRPH
ncbi:KHG/KDPG aldolase [Rubripirellula lacrimiformis]|uniref:KHG/KDPG aldolase n=1 Tax=Rubripirellula lacrimiformis TaxID=1930273 RepID=A0A517NIA2_9BACT|nr:bifunctional 4-hydroxy-2-oxoglutarate aldolase/2-dehydro-3-deoxy-phosphogluconate aldolase [Rubripirellula lacrimiformis]QDT06862.1 KHG/KDPG aldolase [Rubripirellula lacrimiformis]